MPNRIDALRKQIAAEADAPRKATLERQLAVAQQGWEELKEITPTPPNVTYSRKKVVNLGGREVQLLFLGRGHTNGDTVIYLPKEKIVCTGDLMESQIAYMGDAQFDEWVTTLEALKKLDFETDLPGHGAPFRGKELITAFQGYLTDLMKQGAALRAAGRIGRCDGIPRRPDGLQDQFSADPGPGRRHSRRAAPVRVDGREI